jgi:DNA invertase Pin-like site-specific DNA recombinase
MDAVRSSGRNWTRRAGSIRVNASGKDTNRPQLQAAFQYAHEGDTLVVHSMDLLARNAEDLLRTVRELTGRGVTVEFVKNNLTTTCADRRGIHIASATALLGIAAASTVIAVTAMPPTDH